MPRNNFNGTGSGKYGLYGGDRRGIYTYGGHTPRRGVMIYGRQPKRWPYILLVVLIVLIVGLCIRQFACGGIFPQEDTQDSTAQTQTAQEDSSSDSELSSGDSSLNGSYEEGLNATIQVSAVGDCTLATDENFSEDTSFVSVYQMQKKNSAYFFKRVKKYLVADQLSLCNFEGVLSNEGTRADKDFAFEAPPSYAKILVAGSIEAANLANNHSFDYGEEAYEDTKETLAAYDITSFGFDRVATYETDGVKIGLFGINALYSYSDSKKLMKQDIKKLKKQNCAIIIGTFHWGIEGEHDVEEDQVSLAHAAIDNGCDLVCGGHPHMLQGVEIYKDRYICYSLGNFVFGGNDDPSDYNTMIFQQTFTIENGQLKIDEDTLSSVDIVPCWVSTTTELNTYQPLPLSGSNAKSLIKALNGYSSKLDGDAAEFSTKLNSDGCAVLETD